MSKVTMHTKYEPPVSPSVSFPNPSRTQQNFRDEADINNIMRKYEKTGFLVDPLRPGTQMPMFDDFVGMADFQTAQNIIASASQAFALLSSDIRERFNNDPAKMLQFLENADNRDEAVKLGLVNPPAAPPADPPVTPPAE